jgi:hypothetical protein
MKTFKELMEEKAITENLDEIQEMAYTDVQIAYDNAKRIMEMMDEGIEPESWNYSKITMAADYLTSVYTAMRAKKSEMPDFGSYYEETDLTEARKIVGKYQDYHLEKSKETKVTEKHPQGAPIYALFFDGMEIGKITPYSGTIDKKKPGSRIVSDRKYVTLYSIDFAKEEKIPYGFIPVHSKMGHRTPKEALDTAAMYYDRWLQKNEEVNLEESNRDDFRAKLIHRVVSEYADGKKDIRGVSLDNIAAAFASKKNFGNKSKEELEDELGLPIGVIIKLVKEVQSELKANMSGSTSGQTQAQRIDRYLKQKWVK